MTGYIDFSNAYIVRRVGGSWFATTPNAITKWWLLKYNLVASTR